MFNKNNIQKDVSEKYNAYDSKKWEKIYFDEKSSGYVVVDKQRKKHSKLNKNEKIKFNKELEMALVFAKNGFQIELLEEVPRIPSPDAKVNGILAELKKVSSHNNIVKEAKEALCKKGAEMVLFEFETNTKEIHLELLKLKRRGILGCYFFTDNKGKIYDFNKIGQPDQSG